MSQMTLKVKKVNQINPKTQEMGYAARVSTNGTETFDDLVDYASHNTSLHRVEVASAAQLILEAAARALKNGKIVDLGPLGKIRPSVLSKWVTDPKKLTKSDLSKSLIYSPSADIEAAIQSAKLAWSNAADEEEDEDGGGATVIDDDNSGLHPTSEDEFTLSVTAGTGIASVDGGGTVQRGASATLTATVSEGYTFDGWYDGDTKQSSSNPYTLTMPSANLSLEARAAQSGGNGGNGGGGFDTGS